MDFQKQSSLLFFCFLWNINIASGFHISPQTNLRQANRRLISPRSSQLRIIPNQSSSRRTYDSSKSVLQPSSRQWNSRKTPVTGPSANTRARYGKALLSKILPMRRAVQKPVIRRKIGKLVDRIDTSKKTQGVKSTDQGIKKPPVKDRDYTFHAVFLADLFCRLCDNLQGEWRTNCREQRCARADNS
ncbi:uncharacterized protein LOC133206022 [Saccostrea echinata]|uniref:uncharacterized protein LOC133206022 n=1 Tax=Saccostrea echinata TaxID=191078 RepID=UPI002A7F8FB3|nr:uncharacterized protein LOC133206022 [Saccostrea echinata]